MDKLMNVLIIGENSYIKRLSKYAIKYGMSITIIKSPEEIDNINKDLYFEIVFYDYEFDINNLINSIKQNNRTKDSTNIIINSTPKLLSSEEYFSISSGIKYCDFESILRLVIKLRKMNDELHDLQDDFCLDYNAEITDDLRKYELEALNAISITISGSLDLQVILDMACSKILEISGMGIGIIYLVDEKNQNLTMAAQHGLTRKVAEAISVFPISPGSVASQIVNSGQPVIRNSFEGTEFPVTYERLELISGLDIKTFVAIPLKTREQITGILYLINNKIKIVTSNDLEILTLAGNQVGIAIDNARLYKAARYELEERKKTEVKLENIAGLYSRVLDNINDIIFSADINGRVLYMSNVVEKMFGYTSEEILGKPFTVYVHQDDLPLLIKKFQQVLEGRYEPSTYRIRHKDGTYLWVKSSSKVFYKDGKPAGINGVITDVTSLKTTEFAIDEKLKMISNLTANIPGFIFKLRHTKGIGWIFDYISDGVNDIGYTSVEITNNFMLFIGTLRIEDQGILWATLDDSLRNHTDIEMMLRYRSKNGYEVNMQFAAKPQIWNDNDAVWYGCAIRLDGVLSIMNN
jgi:PAS domain S-box-containing protein